MTPNRTFTPSPTKPTTPAATTETRYAPDKAALARELSIRDEDVIAVIDARGGTAYEASLDTGLANRFPFVDAGQRKRAVQRALSTGAIVRTPMGVLRRPPRDDE